MSTLTAFEYCHCSIKIAVPLYFIMGRLEGEAPEKVDIVFDRVSVEAKVPLGRRTVPTLPNAIVNGAKVTTHLYIYYIYNNSSIM